MSPTTSYPGAKHVNVAEVSYVKHTYDIWVTPRSLDLEGFTALLEPSSPLPTLIVLKLCLFVSPDKRGVGLDKQHPVVSGGPPLDGGAAWTHRCRDVFEQEATIPPGLDDEDDNGEWDCRSNE